MTWRWHWIFYRGLLDAELQSRLSSWERLAILRDLPNHTPPSRFASTQSAQWLLMIPLNIAAITLANRYLTQSGPMLRLLVLIALTCVAITSIPWLIRRQNTRSFYAAVRERGYDVCPKCGYWLQDLGPTIAQCPECGATRLRPPRQTRQVLKANENNR